MDEDPLSFLQHSTKEDIMTFLKRILDEYHVRKRKTPLTWGSTLMWTLPRLYNLDLSTKEKPVMNVDDVFLVLHHYWVMDTATFPTGDNGYRLLSWY